MIELIKGSKRDIPMQITRRRGGNFIISSVECEVVNRQDTVIESGSGNIDGDIITYFLDTSSEDFLINRIYTIYYSVEILGLGKVIKDSRDVKIIK